MGVPVAGTSQSRSGVVPIPVSVVAAENSDPLASRTRRLRTGDSVGVSADVAGAASRRPTETDWVKPVLVPGAT